MPTTGIGRYTQEIVSRLINSPNEFFLYGFHPLDFKPNVAPSLYEGFGLVVLEAMSFGVPVLTAKISSLPEVAGDAAILVDATDVEAIAAGMRRLIEDRVLHRELSRRGLNRSKLFSWDRASDKTLEVLEAVAGQA